MGKPYEEKMSAVIAKDALLTAMPTRSNSFSQSSCQVQTEVISLNSNETQTYEKQTREIKHKHICLMVSKIQF